MPVAKSSGGESPATVASEKSISSSSLGYNDPSAENGANGGDGHRVAVDPTLRRSLELVLERRYRDAAKLLLSHPNASDPVFKAQISAVMQLVRESEKGEYDLRRLFHESLAIRDDPRLQHAEYLGPVEKRWISKQRGFGLVATRDVAAGELLIGCKAFAIAMSPKLIPATHQLPAKDEQELLFQPILTKVGNCQDHIKEINGLFAGPYFPRESESDAANENEGELVLDDARVRAVIKFNGFPIRVAVHQDTHDEDRLSRQGNGLWILPSFLNHSCVANCDRVAYGDFMLIRAMQAISKGDELTRCYCISDAPYRDRQLFLTQHYGFACDCALCKCDQANLAARPSLDAQRTQFMDANKEMFMWLNRYHDSSPELIPDMMESIKEFNLIQYKNRFDMALFELYVRLAITLVRNRRFDPAFEVFMEGLSACIGPAGGNVEFVAAPPKQLFSAYATVLCCFADDSSLPIAKAKPLVDALLRLSLSLHGTDNLETVETIMLGEPTLQVARTVVARFRAFSAQNARKNGSKPKSD